MLSTFKFIASGLSLIGLLYFGAAWHQASQTSSIVGTSPAGAGCCSSVCDSDYGEMSGCYSELGCQLAGGPEACWSTPCKTETCQSGTGIARGPACTACATEAALVPAQSNQPGEIFDPDQLGSDHQPIGDQPQRIHHASDQDFERYVNDQSGKVLVDFYADWCGPCRLQSAILDEFVKSHPKAPIVKVNIDDSPELAERFSIVSIPTLVIFRNGETVAVHAGLADSDKLYELIR